MSLSKEYHRAKAQQWTRRCSDAVALQKFWTSYKFKQRIAKSANWDRERFGDVCDDFILRLRRDLCPLEPLPLENTPCTFNDLSRSAGFCMCGNCKKKSDIPMNELYECQKLLREVGARRQHASVLPKYKIAFRSQIRKVQAKRRVILVSPGPLAFCEKRFAHPLQQALERAPWPRPWATGWDWFASGGQQVSQFLNSPNVYSFDFQTFDHSSPVWLTREVFRVIAACFNMTYEDKLVLKGILASHTDSIADFNGQQFHLTGGIRTGSSFTHIIGTFTGILVFRYLLGVDLDSVHYGDDLLVRTTKSLKYVCRLMKRQTSFTLSQEKSKYGVSWLGYKWENDRWVVEDPDKRWAQLFFPERPNPFIPRVQAMLINSLSDPMRIPLLAFLRQRDALGVSPETYTLLGLDESTLHHAGEPMTVTTLELALKRHHKLD
jgi:hypothetical protein